MVELEKLFCAFADTKTLVVMRSPLIFDFFFLWESSNVLHLVDELNYGFQSLIFISIH